MRVPPNGQKKRPSGRAGTESDLRKKRNLARREPEIPGPVKTNVFPTQLGNAHHGRAKIYKLAASADPRRSGSDLTAVRLRSRKQARSIALGPAMATAGGSHAQRESSPALVLQRVATGNSLRFPVRAARSPGASNADYAAAQPKTSRRPSRQDRAVKSPSSPSGLHG